MPKTYKDEESLANDLEYISQELSSIYEMIEDIHGGIWPWPLEIHYLRAQAASSVGDSLVKIRDLITALDR